MPAPYGMGATDVLQLLVTTVLGYLVGAIPTGMLVARVYRNVDLTRVGSQRTGATNVLRTLGLGAAAIVFAGDALKSVLAAIAAGAFSDGNAWAIALACTAAVVGHSYSPYIGFRGGRGVTPGLGGLFIIAPWTAAAALVSGGLLILLTRYVSLGSIVGAAVGGTALALHVVLGGQPPAYLLYALLGVPFIVFTHRDNIARLARGTERKLGERAEAD